MKEATTVFWIALNNVYGFKCVDSTRKRAGLSVTECEKVRCLDVFWFCQITTFANNTTWRWFDFVADKFDYSYNSPIAHGNAE